MKYETFVVTVLSIVTTIVAMHIMYVAPLMEQVAQCK